MPKIKSIVFAAAMLGAAASANADTYTYKYVGPNFVGKSDHIEITFTTSAPLAPSKSFLSTASANVISSAVNVVGPNGVVAGSPLPITTFQIHTNSTASTSAAGIDSWYIMGDVSNLTGTAPTMTGTHYQAYTMNTMAFIPGSDIPGATGLVTGRYNYDQATVTTFYASCTGIAGCQLAGNGQPYVGQYSGIINPANTSANNWRLTVNVTQPPAPAPLSLTGTLPDGQIYASYSAALTATGGTPPYSWSATGLPPGLTISSATGAVAGTPTTVGSYSPTVTVTDSATTRATRSVTSNIVINAPSGASYSCTAPSGSKKFQFKGTITKVGNGYIVVGSTVIQTPTCTRISWNGANGFAVGQIADTQGYITGGVSVAQKITIN